MKHIRPMPATLPKALRRPRIVLVLGLLVWGFCLGRATAADSLSSQALDDFKWFGTLGFPDTKDCPYVQVATGEWVQYGGNPPQNRYVKAFLLGTEAPKFRVLTLDLFDRRFVQTNPPSAEHVRVGYEKLDLQSEAVARTEGLRNPPDKKDSGRRFGERTTERAEVFVLAWACWRNGLDTEAEQLYVEAQKLRTRNGAGTTGAEFREALEKDLGHAMMWRAILGFEDPAISRAELLVQFEKIVTNYAHSEHIERAKQTAAILKRMVAEDQEHAKLMSTNLDQLRVPEQVRELIFRLRDQNGHQYSQPGWCDIFASINDRTNTPAHRLVRLGYAAVPQLIAALDDPTFSRSVGYHRDFYFSHTVLTVGDCARSILERISGKSFFRVRSTYSYMSMDGQVSPTRKAAEAWWAELNSKGEKEMLIEAVGAGAEDAPRQATMLCERYPEVAAKTLIRGAKGASNSWVRAQLVRQLAKLGDAQVVAFLSEELVKGPMLESRVAAAYALRSREKSEAVEAMIREWTKSAGVKRSDDNPVDLIIQFLGSSDSVPAIEALGRDLRKRPVSTRLEVVERLGSTNHYFAESVQSRSPETVEAVEKYLVEALEDTEERVGLSTTRQGKTLSDPRICDLSACCLAELWPDRYTFVVSNSRRARDRQRVVSMNVWRRAHRLPDLPLPQSSVVRVKPEEANFVTSIQWIAGEVKPDAETSSKVERLRGRALEAKQITKLVTDFAEKPYPGASGIELNGFKDEDLTGVTLIIRLFRRRASADSQDWQTIERVTLSGGSLQSSFGSGSLSAYSDLEHWDDFTGALTKALAAEPNRPFEFRVGLRAGKSE